MVICVYDSGIGGLTTLVEIAKSHPHAEYVYFADNLNHPFGTMDNKALCDVVYRAVQRMKNNSDVQVLACNTASSVYAENDVIKLLPPVNACSPRPEKTLLMATDRTLENVKNDCIKVACTSELATLIEIQASLRCEKDLDMSALIPYLKKRIGRFYGVDSVILGCSHYPYCKKQIRAILGNVEFLDGNQALLSALKDELKRQNYVERFCEEGADIPKVRFVFSGADESKKYRKILSHLLKNQTLKS